MVFSDIVADSMIEKWKTDLFHSHHCLFHPFGLGFGFKNEFLTRVYQCQLEAVFHFLLDSKRNLSSLVRDVGIFVQLNRQKEIWMSLWIIFWHCCRASVFTLGFIFYCFLFFQWGQKHDVRPTETAFWVWQDMVHGDPDLPLDSTSLHVMRMVPMNPCSATAVQDTAGVWTETDRRSQELALALTADQCVSKSQMFITELKRPQCLLLY